jgi:hypothetical protein
MRSQNGIAKPPNPTIDHFVGERLEMKAKTKKKWRSKRGVIDEVQ